MHLKMLSLALIVFMGCGDDTDFTATDGDDDQQVGSASLSVMTRNLYLGGDISDALQPGCEGLLVLGCLAGIYNDVQTSDIPGRMAAVADEIMEHEPDLVGLQEVATFFIQDPGDQLPGQDGTQATDVAFNLLELLEAELLNRGLAYSVAATNVNIDTEVPSSEDNVNFIDLRLVDSDVILVKDGIEVNETVGGNFEASQQFGVSGFDINIVRGYSAASVTVDDIDMWFVNSHLEVGGPFVQTQIDQATELLTALSVLSGPMMVVGDFNSNPTNDGAGGEAYSLLTAEYNDMWDEQAMPDGNTCCQDGDLRNPESDLSSRIDLILADEDFSTDAIERVGIDPGNRVGDELLWPSDHAGVVADLIFSNE